MASSRIPESVKQVFTATFTVRDVAEPVASFDDATEAVQVQDFMKANDFDVVGIRREGHIVGFVEREALQTGVCGQYQRPLSEAKVLSESAPLLTAVLALSQAPFLFVTALGRVGGIVTRADLQKPPVRMWLFGIVTLVEMRFAELIERYCPGDAWKEFLSEGRLQKAQALLAERSRRNQKLHLLDCLQFADKGQIVARNEEIRNATVFESRRQAEETTKRLEQLRNNLAHAQDIVGSDWDTITQLCAFISEH